MHIFKNRKSINLITLPLLGICLFVILYIISALKYTNRMDTFSNSISFSYKETYLCDLLNVYTDEGIINPAHITTRIALVIICFSLILFWYELPKLFLLKRNTQTFMQFSGMLSMVILLFLNSDNHDTIIRFAGAFGAIAIILSLLELFKARYYKGSILGFIFLIMFFINYYLYEFGVLLELLPIIQKVTFVLCLIWLLYLNTILYLQLKHQKN